MLQALDRLIKDAGLSTFNQCIPLAICTSKEHAFVMVDSNLVCDPWISYVGSVELSPIKISYYKELFAINANWSCFDEGYYDRSSTEFTITLFVELLNEEHFNNASNKIECDNNPDAVAEAAENNEMSTEEPCPRVTYR